MYYRGTLDLMGPLRNCWSRWGPLHLYGLAADRAELAKTRQPQYRGNHLSGSQASALEQPQVGCGGMGHLGDRTPRQVLLSDAQREKADRAGDPGLGAHRRHHGALPFPVELGGRQMDLLTNSSSAVSAVLFRSRKARHRSRRRTCGAHRSGHPKTSWPCRMNEQQARKLHTACVWRRHASASDLSTCSAACRSGTERSLASITMPFANCAGRPALRFRRHR